jgi:hypothetical protein
MENHTMKLSRDDFKIMRGSLIGCTIAVVFCLLMIIVSLRQTTLRANEWQTAQHQLGAAQSELINAQQDLRNQESYQQEYALALQQHWIGKETRMDWVAQLANLRGQKLSPEFQYEIGAPQLYTATASLDCGSFAIYYSTLHLHLALRHEAQLLQALNTLNPTGNGNFVLQGCSIQRSSDPSPAAALQAQCSGQWISFQPRNTSP